MLHTPLDISRRPLSIPFDAIPFFWSQIDRSGGDAACWPWLGIRHEKGYGIFFVGGQIYRAHRASYRLFVGAFDELLAICHSCDNPPCVNPAHLWAGSILANNQDRAAKGRARGPLTPRPIKTVCSQGHPKVGDNLYVGPNGDRLCRTCRATNDIRRRARRRASRLPASGPCRTP